MKRSLVLFLVLGLLLWAAPAAGASTLTIVTPGDGATVTAPVTIAFSPNTGGQSFSFRMELAPGYDAATGFREIKGEVDTTIQSPNLHVRWTPQEVSGGKYTLRVTTYKPGLNQTEVISQGTRNFVLSGPDYSPKLTLQVEPVVSGPVPLQVSVSDADLESWALEVRDSAGKAASIARGASNRGLPTAWDATGLLDGVYTLRLTAADQVGNQAVLEKEVRVKNPPPSLTLDMVRAEQELSYLPITYTALTPVRLTVTVPRGILTEVRQGEVAGKAGAGQVAEVPVDLSGFEPGPYTATVKAVDAQGRTSSGTFTVSVLPPLPAPVLGELAPFSLKDVRLRITQPEGVSVEAYEMYRTDSAGTRMVFRIRPGPGADILTADVPEREGEHIYRVVMVTRDGRRRESVGRRTFVDLAGPAPGTVAVAPVVGRGLVMRWEAATDAVGVAGYQVFLLEGTERRLLADLGPDARAFLAPLPEGEYAAVLAVVDRSGRTTEAEPVVFSVIPGAVSLWHRGKFVAPDMSGFMEDGRTWVPLRLFGEALGYEVIWNQARQTATLQDRATGRLVVATVGEAALLTADREHGQRSLPLPAAPRLVGSRVMVPLRALVEALGARVNWVEASHTVELLTE